MLKRYIHSFLYSVFFGLLANLLIELVVRIFFGIDYSPLTPEYIDLFPSYSIALMTDMLLYGVLGMTFSVMMFVYEFDRIGFVIQNILYYFLTGVIWIPIVTFVWQLQRYPKALWGVLMGFVATDIIMTLVGYRTTKKNIMELNEKLRNQQA